MPTLEIQATRLEDISLQHRHLQVAETIGRQALGGMDLHYGGLAYHNASHLLVVRATAKRLMHELGVSQLGQVTGEAASLAHDIVQCKPRGVMERESAEWFERQLRRKFPKPAIEAGRLAILGTEPILKNDKYMGQMASRLSYPSLEAEQIALSVASADIGGEIFRPLGPLRGHMWYKEMQGVNDPTKSPSWSGFPKYQEEQISFVSDYQFPHALGEAVLGSMRSSVVAYHERLAADVRAGTVDSWEQVIARDLAFALAYGEALPKAGVL